MRSDIAPGGTFHNYELPDHTSTPRMLSELQGDDPLILTLGARPPEGAPAAIWSAPRSTPRNAVACTQLSPKSPRGVPLAPPDDRLGGGTQLLCAVLHQVTDAYSKERADSST